MVKVFLFAFFELFGSAHTFVLHVILNFVSPKSEPMRQKEKLDTGNSPSTRLVIRNKVTAIFTRFYPLKECKYGPILNLTPERL